MRIPVLILAVAALSAPAATSFADTGAEAKRAIQAETTRAMHLILKQDFDALTKMCTPDCTFTENGQTMDIKRVVTTMKAEMAVMKDVKMTSTILTCKLKGDTADCTSRDTMAAMMKGADKKWHKVTSNGTSKLAFVKKGGAWLMKSNATISEKVLMDGKPFNPSAAQGGAPGQ